MVKSDDIKIFGLTFFTIYENIVNILNPLITFLISAFTLAYVIVRFKNELKKRP